MKNKKVPKSYHARLKPCVLVHCDISAIGRYGAHTMLTGAC